MVTDRVLSMNRAVSLIRETVKQMQQGQQSGKKDGNGIEYKMTRYRFI